MSDTPRTDKMWRGLWNLWSGSKFPVAGVFGVAIDMFEHAKELERELNALKLPGVSTPPKPAVQPKPRRKK